MITFLFNNIKHLQVIRYIHTIKCRDCVYYEHSIAFENYTFLNICKKFSYKQNNKNNTIAFFADADNCRNNKKKCGINAQYYKKNLY
jgi:hypothetical protein